MSLRRSFLNNSNAEPDFIFSMGSSNVLSDLFDTLRLTNDGNV